MKSVGIIGQGRFGCLLKQWLSQAFNVVVYDLKNNNAEDLSSVLAQETVFIATPIRSFKTVIQEIVPRLCKNALIIDVCSVKMYPCEVMQTLLPKNVDIIGTHPLFGPDSWQGGSGNMVMTKIRDQYQRYAGWKAFFSQRCKVIEMAPEKHDALMAQSQGITHLIGRTLDKISAQATGIDTQGYQTLLSVMKNTCNDSWELFYDLHRYNPYAKEKNQQLLKALQTLTQQLEELTDEKFQ